LILEGVFILGFGIGFMESHGLQACIIGAISIYLAGDAK